MESWIGSPSFYQTTLNISTVMDLKIENRAFDAVALQDVKLFIREDRDINDPLIESLIKTAEKVITDYTGYYISDTEFSLSMERFKDIKLPYRPIKEGSISITYGEQTLPDSKWDFIDGEIQFVDDLPEAEEVQISFTCGSDDEDQKTAIKLLTMIYYRRDIPESERENINPLQISVLRSLLIPNKVRHFK